MQTQWTITQPQDFQSIIEDIFQSAPQTDALIICLVGDLGAGKTTFTQQLGEFLGVVETITSPTFSIMKRYDTQKADFSHLVHIDAYRIESLAEVVPLQIETLLTQKNTIVCIEWPEHLKAIIPDSAVWLKIEIAADEVRRVTITNQKEQ